MENENKQRFIQFPETYDRRRLNKMYRAAGVPDRKSYLLRNYFCAMANLYGTISLAEAWQLIHAYHPRGAITEEQFWTFAELARHEDEGYDIMGLDECFADEPPHTPQERSIISGILFDTDKGYADMLNWQRGKPLYVPATQEEMLYYADWRYVEATPWQKKTRGLSDETDAEELVPRRARARTLGGLFRRARRRRCSSPPRRGGGVGACHEA